MNLGQFAKRMQDIASGIGTNTEDIMKKIGIAVHTSVVSHTPADTGQARSSWILSKGGPASETNTPYAPGKNLGLLESGNLAGSVNQAKGVLGSYKLSDGTIWVSNNLDYIGELENGKSDQAPKGMAKIGVLAGVAAIPQAKVIR